MKWHKAVAVSLIAAFVFASTNAQAHGFSTRAIQAISRSLTAAGYMGAARYATAALPTCSTANLSAIAWDTTTSSLKVCNGSAFAALGGGGATGISFNDDVALTFGTGNDSDIEWDTAQTPDAWVFGVGTDSRILWVREKGDTADYGLAQQTNPMLGIHSSADTANQYIALSHNQTNGVIDVGTGSILAADAIIGADGSATAPSYGFSSDADGSGTGMFRRAANVIGLTTDGTQIVDIFGTGTPGVRIASGSQYVWGATTVTTAPDVGVERIAAGAIAVTNGTTGLGAIAYTQQAVTVDGATTFAVTSNFISLACTGAETINTITGGVQGLVLYIEHTDTDCTIADDESPTASNAIDLTGAANDVGAVAKFIVLVYNGTHWSQVSESDN